MVVNYTYDAWGNIISVTGSSAGTIGAQNPIRYRGYLYDEETKYYFCKTRYYNPQWRRWLNKDGYFIAGNDLTGSNMYAYCSGNPVMRIDPNGMVDIASGIGLGIAIGCFLFADYLGIGQTLVLPFLQKNLDEEVFMFAAILFAEGGNLCGNDELNAMAWTIRNRISHPGFTGNTYRALITAKGQYDAYGNDDYNTALSYLTGNGKGKGTKNMLNCLRIVLCVYFDILISDTTGGATVYQRDYKGDVTWGKPTKAKTPLTRKEGGTWYHTFWIMG